MQTSAAAAMSRRRRAMLAARARGGRRSGALVASRCAANKRALSATGQARLLEQSELVRWTLGFGNGFRERSGRPAVTVWARVKRLVQLGVDDAGRPRTIFFSAGRAAIFFFRYWAKCSDLHPASITSPGRIIYLALGIDSSDYRSIHYLYQ